MKIISTTQCSQHLASYRPEFSGHQTQSHRHDALAHVRLFGYDLYTVTEAS